MLRTTKKVPNNILTSHLDEDIDASLKNLREEYDCEVNKLTIDSDEQSRHSLSLKKDLYELEIHYDHARYLLEMKKKVVEKINGDKRQKTL